MSENEDSTMSEESDAGTSRSHQKDYIFRKYTKIMAFVMVVIQTILMKMMKTNIILKKKEQV